MFKKIFIVLSTIILSSSYLIDIALSYGYESPIFQAIKTKNIDQVEYFLSHGYAVNMKDISGNTPLTYAIQSGDLKIVKLLLSYGADPNIYDSTGYSVYCSAKFSNNKKIKSLFKQYNDARCPKIVSKNSSKPKQKIIKKVKPKQVITDNKKVFNQQYIKRAPITQSIKNNSSSLFIAFLLCRACLM